MNRVLFILIISWLLIGRTCSCQGQIFKNIHRLDSLFEPEKKVDYRVFTRGSKNEIESTFSAMFLFYKKFISSQDIDACVFQPSCSVYAIECIHYEKSKLVAFLKISDRLMRCHGLVSPKTYKIDKLTGKYADPIED